MIPRLKIKVWQIAASAGLILLLLGLVWQVRCSRTGPALTPYLAGDKTWPDSLTRNLPIQQQLGQLIIYKPVLDLPQKEMALYALTEQGATGGLWLEGLNLLNYLFLMDSLQRTAPIPLFMFAGHSVLHNNLFADVDPAPSPATVSAIPENAYYAAINKLFPKQSRVLGLNLVAPIDLDAPWRDSVTQQLLLQTLSDQRIIAGVQGFAQFDPNTPDTLPQMAQFLGSLQQLHKQGIGLMYFDRRIAGTDSLAKWPDGFLYRYLSNLVEYEGLLVGVISEEAPLEYWIQAGADLFITSEDPGQVIGQMEQLLNEGAWTRGALRRSLRKVFLAKQWMYGSRQSKHPAARYQPLQYNIPAAPRTGVINRRNRFVELDQVWQHFRETNWTHLNYKLREQALILSNDRREFLPWKDMKDTRFYIWQPGSRAHPDFEHFFEKYAPFEKIERKSPETWIPKLRDTLHSAVVVLLEPQNANPLRDTTLLKALQEANRRLQLIVVNFGIPQLHRLLDSSFTIIHLFEQHPHTESLAAQLFFGGVAAQGQWPLYDTLGPPVQKTKAMRLGYSAPEMTGIAPEKLVGIDAIARSAVDREVIPGCQVLVAKDNRIIYSKAFGKPTYSDTLPVQTGHIYDVASLTKVAATSLALMYLQEQGALELNDRLDKHIPWLNGKETGRITIRNLLTHQSGLPAGLNITTYINARKNSRRSCDLYFCDRERPPHTIPVAKNLYFNARYLKDIRDKVANTQPRKKPGYRYSDVNFWLLQQLVETKTHLPLDSFVTTMFYQPMGMRHTRFLAARYFPQKDIIPTEYDKVWRRQLLRGYVHDPAAALFGGVAGHAGLFSNAEDMAKFLQLMLNKGSYGGQQWFSPAQVDRFTQSTYGNHRSLGFDRPSKENLLARARSAPQELFGHTGFTGACAWADPQNGLIYIFLSNRVYPDGVNRAFIREGIRGRIHQVVYDALGSYAAEFPSLP